MSNIKEFLKLNFSCPSPQTFVFNVKDSCHYDNFLIAFLIVNVWIAFVAISANMVIIYIITVTQTLRTPSNMLILGLAISDLFVGILSQPSYCLFMFSQVKRNLSMFCPANLVFLTSICTFATMSFLTLITITADRFLAVHLHLRYQELVTTKRYGITLACILGFCLFVSVCRVFIEQIQISVFVAVILLASLLLMNAFFIVTIYQFIHRRSVQIQAQQQSVQQSIDMPRYRKSVNTMYYVIGAFVVCYIPYAGRLVALAINPKEIQPSFFSTVTETLVMFNGVLNPVIYCWRIKHVRNVVLRLLRREMQETA
jgi:hypothetical protein